MDSVVVTGDTIGALLAVVEQIMGRDMEIVHVQMAGHMDGGAHGRLISPPW